MKRKIKIYLTIFVVAAILFTAVAVTVSAEDAVVTDSNTVSEPKETLPNTENELSDPDTNSGKNDTGAYGAADIDSEVLTEGENGTDKKEHVGEGVVNKNPFESFYETILSYSGEIFCLVTLIVSLFLTYAFKRGLVPLLKSAVGAIGGAVGTLKEKADTETEKIELLSAETEANMQALEKGLTKVTDTLSGIALKLAQLESDKDSRERASLVLLSQTEMLYDLIMTSALPAYQKEAIGEKMLKMKEKINEGPRGSEAQQPN